MVSLNNNVRKSNVIDRWEDYVADDARGGLVWGLDAKPFSTAPDDWFGGDIASPPAKDSYVSDSNISGTLIEATATRNALVTGTTQWTHLRNMRAVQLFNSQGTQQGTFDDTQKAYQETGQRVDVTDPAIPPQGPSNNGNLITIGSDSAQTGMEHYLARLRGAYRTIRDDAVYREQTVCHYSCHYSCHGSRGRR